MTYFAYRTWGKFFFVCVFNKCQRQCAKTCYRVRTEGWKQNSTAFPGHFNKFPGHNLLQSINLLSMNQLTKLGVYTVLICCNKNKEILNIWYLENFLYQHAFKLWQTPFFNSAFLWSSWVICVVRVSALLLRALNWVSLMTAVLGSQFSASQGRIQTSSPGFPETTHNS